MDNIRKVIGGLVILFFLAIPLAHADVQKSLCKKIVNCLAEGAVSSLSVCNVTEIAACTQIQNNFSNSSSVKSYVQHNFSCWLADQALSVAMGGDAAADNFLTEIATQFEGNLVSQINCSNTQNIIDVCKLIEDDINANIDRSC